MPSVGLSFLKTPFSPPPTEERKCTGEEKKKTLIAHKDLRTHPSPLSQQTPYAGTEKARAETSRAFQKSDQLRADEGQFPLFKNKARSDTTGL